MNRHYIADKCNKLPSISRLSQSGKLSQRISSIGEIKTTIECRNISNWCINVHSDESSDLGKKEQ